MSENSFKWILNKKQSSSCNTHKKMSATQMQGWELDY